MNNRPDGGSRRCTTSGMDSSEEANVGSGFPVGSPQPPRSSLSTSPLPVPPADGNPAAKLHALCAAFVSEEESALTGLLRSVREVRAILLHGGIEELERSWQLQQDCATELDARHRQRAQFRQEAAACLGLPAESIVLERLLEHVPRGEAQALRQARQRLRGLAAEVERVGRGNRILMHYTLDFFQRILLGLTGGRGSGSYARSGKPLPAASHSLIQARG